MAGVITLTRSDWLGFRWQRHGLSGHSGKDVLDDLLLLGIRNSGPAGAEQSLIQRTSRIGSVGVANAISLEGPLVSLWSVRGAPHAHRLTHLDFVRDALAPQASDDGGPAYVEAVAEVAAALSAVVTGPTSKADASTEVTARVSPALVSWCARCKADHVPDGLFRAAGRQALLVLGPDRATTLHPTPKHPQEEIDHPRLELLRAFFRVNGPTSRPLFRDWTESGTEATADLWKELGDELVRVEIDKRRYDLPEALVDEVRKAPRAEGVALVPPNDAYLRQVDRTLLVPDSKRRGEVWRALSAPGALLVDGEVAGTWRYRRTEHDLTITPFDRLTADQRKQAEQQTQLIAKVSDDDQPKVTWA